MPRGYNVTYTKALEDKVRKLVNQGFSQPEIGRKIGHSRGVVQIIVKKLGLQHPPGYIKNKVKEAHKKLKIKLKRLPTRTELIAETSLDGTTIDRHTKGKLKLSHGPSLQESIADRVAKAKETFATKLYDKVTPSRLGVVLGPKKLINEYLKDFKKRFKYPSTSTEYKKAIAAGEILSNKALEKKYGLSEVGVERTNAILTKEHNLKYPKQTYEGATKVWRDLGLERRTNIEASSSPIIERKVRETIRKLGSTGNIDLAHRASLRANVMFGADYLVDSLGLDKDIVNQQLVKPFERELTQLYKAQKKLVEGLRPGKFPNEIQKQISQLNKQIMDMSAKTDGALQGVLMNEKTGKVGHIFGKDYSKVLGAGLVEGSVKGLAPEKLDLIKAQLPEQMKATGGAPNKLIETLTRIFNSKETTLPQKNRIGVALGCVGAAEGGRIGYALGSTAVNCVNTKLTNEPVQSSMKLRVAEGVGKIKPAATNFLKLLGRGGARAAPLAALAAAGAAIEPLVKQFRNDDPNTYLTHESQMKGMLLATIEGETPKVDEELLNWQYPGMAAATAAGAIPGAGAVYKGRRGLPPTKDFVGPMAKGVGKTRAALGLSGVLGKALGASFSPLAVAATLPLTVAAQRKGGTEWGDIATDPMNWMAPAFASTGAEMASKGIKNPLLLKALRLGMSPKSLSIVSRRFGLPGLAISAGLWGYDKWKNRSINDE